MAIGDPYATLSDLQDYLAANGLTTTPQNSRMTSALASSSAEIERHCGRQFNQAAAVSTRTFIPEDWEECETDDFFTLVGLVVAVDPGGTGDFSEVLTSMDYEVYPMNGLREGMPWPYNELRSLAGVWLPRIQFRRAGTVQVTAQWGWPSVPAPVHQACLVLAAQEFAMAGAPLGQAGMTDFGTSVKSVSIPKVKELLHTYQRYPIQGG